ncbi:hypothetical protein NPIL_352401 [Nephila pilipes]|uniref:Uncharacterized protein n=1 Tax=Nephila pilipes TaxID=299642 RepID=A0A8X6PZK4_NEPPI|nr:hypothetical protein NPIL_352401 [Nephila pilipes]
MVAEFSGLRKANWQRLQELDPEVQPYMYIVHRNAESSSKGPCPEICKKCSRVEKNNGIDDGIHIKEITSAMTITNPWFPSELQKSQLVDQENKSIFQ